MKPQHLGILIACLATFSGCGKSAKDVAGVYETKEIKSPIKDNVYWHCARAYEDRLTLGFVIPDENMWEMMIEDISEK